MHRQSHRPEPPRSIGNRWQTAAVCGLLALAVALAFGPAAHFEFINLDDSANVYLNPHVTGGLTTENVRWAFGDRYVGCWMPATWLSHSLDCQIHGLNAGGHHATNVLLHAAAVVCLFLAMRQMTGRVWPSAAVAALFAVHPLRAESVCWVTERKDVLSGLFFILMLWAYAGYCKFSPAATAKQPSPRIRWLLYSAVVVFFALGLMAKPMVVTAPFVLLLLDYWPLGRFAAGESAKRTVLRLVLEKLPLFALTIASCVVSLWAYGSEGDHLLGQQAPLDWRLGNAAIAYVSYLGMFFWPVGLATPYPRPSLDLAAWKVAAAAALLVCVTVAAFAWRRKRPYLLVGWLWYLGMLVPVIGVVQFGIQTLGDRFTYLPQIGLALGIVWSIAEASKTLPRRGLVLGTAGLMLLAALTVAARQQASYWKDSVTLWNRTLQCTSENRVAHHCLGTALMDRNRPTEAIEQFRAAIAIEPDYAPAHYNLAVALAGLGRVDEAVTHYEKTLELQPENAAAHNNLGNILAQRGLLEAALGHCREAVHIQPDFPEAHFNLGGVWLVRGRIDEAIAEYRLALESKPDYAQARFCLGVALANRGRYEEAIVEYGKALQSRPPFAAEVHYSLGLALTALRRPEEAWIHYQQAAAR